MLASASVQQTEPDREDALPWAEFRSAEEDQALAEYEVLAAEVTTAGEIWRAGLKLGLEHAATIPLLLHQQPME